MKLTLFFRTFLPLILCLVFSCKKNESTPPVLNVSFDYLKNGMRFTASISNLTNDNIMESGFVWGTTDNPTNGSSFIFTTETPTANFNHSVFSGFVSETTYFLRAYYIDKNNVIKYSPSVSFEGKGTTGIPIEINALEYTWGDQMEIKVNAEQSSDLNRANIYINGTFKVEISKISGKSIFFIIPNDLKSSLNTVSLEIYGQSGPQVYFYLSQPKIDKQLAITGRVNEILKINGDFFNPAIASNLVMIGSTKLEVLNASKTQLEVKLNDAEFAYAGELTVQTGTDLIVKSAAQSKVYKYLSPMSDFPGKERYRPTVEQANRKIYSGLGLSNENAGLNDFWEYNPANNKWTRMADFPAQLYGSSKSFVVRNQIFVIPGFVNRYEDNDMYRFDPATNTWTKVAPYFNTTTRGFSVFSGDQYGYMICGSIDIGGGYLETLKLVHRYDPTTNTWKRLPDFPGTKRREQKAFKVGNKVIVFGGSSLTPHEAGSYPSDCWSFDLTSEKWTQIGNFPSYINTAGSFTFELNGKGYIGGGMGSNGNISSELYEYSPSTNSFIKKDNIFNNIWLDAGAQGIDNKAYILFGTNQYDYHNRVAKEVFEFTP